MRDLGMSDLRGFESCGHMRADSVKVQSWGTMRTNSWENERIESWEALRIESGERTRHLSWDCQKRKGGDVIMELRECEN